MQDSNHTTGPSSEKRRYARTPTRVPIHYQISHEGSWLQGQGHMEAVDVGAGGMRIRVDDELTRGSNLYLQVPLQDGPVFVMGRVAWARHEESGYVGGVEFEGLSEADLARLAAALEMPHPVPQA